MQAKFLINGLPASSVSVTDRGLAYGDGVFETIRITGNYWVLWQQHLERLREGINKLALPYIIDNTLQHRVNTLISQYREASESWGKFNRFTELAEKCVVKIIITRGAGGRAYSPRGCAPATEILACYPFSAPDQRIYKRGIEIRILAGRVSANQQLAGIKHLNRLEQVMASAELTVAEFEGVMCDAQGYLVEGTKSNIILKHKGCWVTPALKRSGVHGVMRKYLLECNKRLGFTIVQKDIRQAECSSIHAMAMVNSVFGIVPVRKIESIELDIDCVINEIQNPIHQALRY